MKRLWRLGMKKKWALCSILLIVGLGITIYLYAVLKKNPTPGPDIVEVPDTSAQAVYNIPEPPSNPPQELYGKAEMEHTLTEVFKSEAMETLPLLTLHTADPLQPDKPGPKQGEIWIRIRPGKSDETRDIMAQVADLYKTILRYEQPVKVMLWVGGQPMARFEY